jgi:hypothetical protein
VLLRLPGAVSHIDRHCRASARLCGTTASGLYVGTSRTSARRVLTAAFKRARQAALERVEAEVARLTPEWAVARSGNRLQLVPDHSFVGQTVAKLPSWHCYLSFASPHTFHDLLCKTHLNVCRTEHMRRACAGVLCKGRALPAPRLRCLREPLCR